MLSFELFPLLLRPMLPMASRGSITLDGYWFEVWILINMMFSTDLKGLFSVHIGSPSYHLQLRNNVDSIIWCKSAVKLWPLLVGNFEPGRYTIKSTKAAWKMKTLRANIIYWLKAVPWTTHLTIGKQTDTVCSRSLDQIYIVTYYIKLGKTSWTDSRSKTD